MAVWRRRSRGVTPGRIDAPLVQQHHVDIRERRHLAPAVAADGDQGDGTLAPVLDEARAQLFLVRGDIAAAREALEEALSELTAILGDGGIVLRAADVEAAGAEKEGQQDQDRADSEGEDELRGGENLPQLLGHDVVNDEILGLGEVASALRKAGVG